MVCGPGGDMGLGEGCFCCGLCSRSLFCAVGLKNGGFLTVSFSRNQSGRLELLADDWRRLFVRQSLPGRLAAEKRNSKESHHFFVTPLQNQGPETEAAAETALPQQPSYIIKQSPPDSNILLFVGKIVNCNEEN